MATAKSDDRKYRVQGSTNAEFERLMATRNVGRERAYQASQAAQFTTDEEEERDEESSQQSLLPDVTAHCITSDVELVKFLEREGDAEASQDFSLTYIVVSPIMFPGLLYAQDIQDAIRAGVVARVWKNKNGRIFIVALKETWTEAALIAQFPNSITGPVTAMEVDDLVKGGCVRFVEGTLSQIISDTAKPVRIV